MLPFIKLSIILLISEKCKSVYGSTHQLIGNYKELNPKDCGITRFTNGFDDKCFKWHKYLNPSLVDGRNATIGEVPWIAKILIQPQGLRELPAYLAQSLSSVCTGSLIANQWVLTAAHCFDTSSDYIIYLGYHSSKSPEKVISFKGTELHIHPHYKGITKNSVPMNDLALIKLKEAIDSFNANKSVFSQFKSICLPQKDMVSTQVNYAMSAGWGQIDQAKMPLQIGYKLIGKDASTEFAKFGDFPGIQINWSALNIIVGSVVDNQTRNCKGDSGSPLWQFDLGRAVLIGVISWGHQDKLTKCEPANKSFHIFHRVSNYIDWITNVTQLQ